jgi:uncharacterized membrane protein
MLPTWLTAGVTALVVLALLDAVWLTAIAPTSRRVIAAIQGTPLQIRWIPAAVVYILIAVAVTAFAILPATGVLDAAGRGALLGLALYGVYDFTNHATLTAYPLPYALADTAWGTFLCGAAAASTYAILKNLPDL